MVKKTVPSEPTECDEIACQEIFAKDNDKNHLNLIPAFHYALDIWWEKPHAIYKLLSGCVELHSTPHGVAWSSTEVIPELLMTENCSKIRQFVPKQNHVFSSESYEIFRKISDTETVFYPGFDTKSGKKNPHITCSYKFLLENNLLTLRVADSSEKERKWLSETLFPKIVSWMQNCDTSASIVRSLRLVDLVAYTDCYNRLKATYAEKIISKWEESTNPEKFVHEDLAIAAYLICYWSSTNTFAKESSSFVDLGCGNGLLCHILASEGFKGCGIDVRKRRIWDTYGPGTALMEKSLTPNDMDCLIDIGKFDWLIGNHSDELTPWIPVMAARMSAKVFLLPCCHWDFYGKYQRREHGISRYRSYLNYVKEIGKTAGFTMEEDRMKIPSTKRVCFIGTPSSAYSENLEAKIEILLKKASSPKNEQNFAPRPVVEIPKNCSTVDKTLRDRLVNRIAKKLLEIAQKVENCDEISGNKEETTCWNPGGSLGLEECADLLNSEEKRALKDQCGGLQTLLRNNSQIFKVVKGTVSLRDWRSEENWNLKAKKKEKFDFKRNNRTCWFWLNHPDGCPLNGEMCRFKHEVEAQ